MIKARFGNQLILGFTEDNIAKFQNDEPMYIDMGELKAPTEKEYWAPASITILYAENMAALEYKIRELTNMLSEMFERLKRETYGGHSPN